VTFVNVGQSWKTFEAILITEEPNAIDASRGDPRNAFVAIVVAALLIITFAKR
jgi:hypothetical protein